MMTSLIKAISLNNFKGFSEEVCIELRPITLLVGANSAGKSSILQALQYMREILEHNNTNPGHTRQGGYAVDLGGFLNLVHGRDPERKIEIEIELDLGDEEIPELVPDAFDEWVGSDYVYDFYNQLQAIRNKVEKVGLRLEISWSEQRETALVTGYQINTNGVWCVRLEMSAGGRDVGMRMNSNNPIFLREKTPEEIELDIEFATLLDDWVKEEDLSAEQGILPSSDMSERYVSVLPELLSVVRDAGVERPGDGLRAWLTGLRSAMPVLDRLLHIPAPGAQGVENVYIAREFTAFLSWLTIGPAMLLREQLRATRYIGPLRRVPPRDFSVSLTKSDSAWSDGSAAWETLLTCSDHMFKRCSDWILDGERLNTGYGLVRIRSQEHDLVTGNPLGRSKSRVALVDQNGLTHQPQDVGVGISQVLPIVVAAQDEYASIVTVEQPELHVHPAVQVGLGDLFIDGAIERGLSFLLETHSEHLILRLLRRIREEAEGEDAGHINPDLLGVYYLANERGCITVTHLPVNTDGDFDTPWPRGFFEERGAELF